MNLIMLIISTIITLILFIYIRKIKNKNALKSVFLINLILIFIWNVALIGQLLFSNKFNINPICFDYITYIGACFLPVSMFFTGLLFSNTKIKFKKSYLFLFVIPILSLLILWTNDLHHLFYVQYSTNTENTIFGPYFYIHSVYTFILFFIALLFLIKYSIRNSGFFSKQSILIILGSLVPLIINLLGLIGVPMNIYLTPISFTITILCFALAIFKFDFLKTTPIALQRIVDRISDGYFVLDDNNNINDFNSTVLKMFNLNSVSIRGKNFFELIKNNNLFKFDIKELKKYIQLTKTSDKTFYFEKKMINKNNYFNIEINSIKNNKQFLGTLILFKDTTQHIIDMQTIENNQNILMERERLASLGQLIGRNCS